jgi:hypothetical protein
MRRWLVLVEGLSDCGAGVLTVDGDRVGWLEVVEAAG